MFKVSRVMREKMNFSGRIAHLSILQIRVLFFLDTKKAAQMKDISTHFNIEKPTATSLLNKLVELDLVIRNADNKDRRVTRISLTKRAKSIIAEIKKKENDKIGKILSYLSENQKQEFLNILETLAEKIESEYEG